MSLNKVQLKESFITFSQYLLPHHLLSRLIGFLCHWENKAWKDYMIKRFGKFYKVNTKEAVSRNLRHYSSFNHFYIRQLKSGARPITKLQNGVASPVDGTVSQAGTIMEGELFQAKGKKFTIAALLGGDSKHANVFDGGIFTTIILSPGDYHRIHMPLDGTLKETVYIPGRLFSINHITVNGIPEIYARNERVVSVFETASGPMALILIGSIFSSSIETVWDGVITPSSKSEIRHWNYHFNPPTAKKGEEIGCFNMGSTVILLFGKNAVNWDESLAPDHRVKMGELIGRTLS
ncbi:MAG: archaetidylserine decarboxylase [Gammaproteobacteria bacterium]